MAGKHAKGRPGAKSGKKFESKKRNRKEEIDQSDREEEQAKEEVAEMQKQATERDFEAFSSNEEEGEEPDYNQMSQESLDQESEEEVAPEFDPQGEYFSTLLKDLRLYDLRLSKLKSLLKSESLHEEGREFVKTYHDLVSLYCLYLMFYMYLTSQKGITFHPVLRQLASIKPQVKSMDKEYARHKSRVTTLIEKVEANEAANSGEEGEEEFHEAMDEEDFEGEEEIDEIPAAKNTVKPSAQPAKKALTNGKLKQKVQVFKLDQQRSYSDIHQYVPIEEDDEDAVLNLTGNRNNVANSSGEITMADFKAFQTSQAEDQSRKKPSKKGRQLYQELAESKDQSKMQANAVKEQTQAALDDYERKLMFTERKVKTDQPRSLSETMLLNRGLKQKRKNVISKVKLRKKYEKAQLQDRVRKGIRVDDGKVKDIHLIRGTGESVVRDRQLN